MKTRLIYEKRCISLVVDHGKDKDKEKMVLGAMNLFEGTRCWYLIDVRLRDHPAAHPWSDSGSGDDFWSQLTAESPAEAAYIKSQLRECEEIEPGTFRWCTFRGIVRGEAEIDGYSPPGYEDFKRPVFHKRAGALAYLKEAQAFWESYEGMIRDSKIDNTHRQATESDIRWGLRLVDLPSSPRGVRDASDGPEI